MPRTANILILCANKSSVDKYKALKILQEFCASTTVVGCKYWEKIDFYYTGLNLLRTTNMPRETIDQNGNREITPWGMKIPRNTNTGMIPVTHQLLPDEIGNLKMRMLPEVFPKFFDVIINENCPRQDNPDGFAITPAELTTLINGSLKLDGFYIDKATADGHFGPKGFQTIYDPHHTGKGLLEKILPEFRVNIETSHGSLWVAYKLKTDLEEFKKSLGNVAKGIKRKKTKKFKKTRKSKKRKSKKRKSKKRKTN